MSTNPAPQGSTNRIDVSEAQAYINGVGIVRFADFDVEYEDESETEDAVDDHRLHYDRPLRASGSFELFPDSPAVPMVFEAMRDRRIGTAVFTLPDNDEAGRIKVSGVRFTNFSKDGSDDGYMYSGDWEGDWAL